MKKIVIILGILLTMNSVYAASPVLDKVETQLYGFTYIGEDDAVRLSRIETDVYGNVSTANNTQRIAKLKTDLAADLIGQQIAPKEDTFEEPEEKYTAEAPPKSDPNVQYPAVDELEKSVFNKVNNGQDITARLSALEQKSFGKVYNDDLMTRVDRLKGKIKPQSLMDNAIAQSSNGFFYDDPDKLAQDYNLSEYDPPENQFDYDAYNATKNKANSVPPRRINLTAMENSILKHSYPNDSMENRLARMESSMFGTIFDADDASTRIDRLSSASKAQKSARRYDANGFSNKAATALQVGTMILMILACIL